jgi:F-type H+-transporting ATPase subunit gamma
MARTRELKKRITAVGTIQRITKTMQMIATAKFTYALQRAKATRPYTSRIRQLVGEVAAAAGDVEHPLFRAPASPVGRELLLVITSDRGLCGAYNGNVLRAAMHHIRRLPGAAAGVTLQTSGKKAIGYFKFQRIAIEERHTIGDKPRYEEVERLAQRYIDAYARGEFDAVRVVSMKFISNSRQAPEVMQLLPVKPPAAPKSGPAGTPASAAVSSAAGPRGAKALYEFSPSAGELLADLLPMSVKVSLFQAFNDAVVSEQIMRMVAMKAATENAKELGKTLRRRFNRARQTQITTELMEIIGGAAALE